MDSWSLARRLAMGLLVALNPGLASAVPFFSSGNWSVDWSIDDEIEPGQLVIAELSAIEGVEPSDLRIYLDGRELPPPHVARAAPDRDRGAWVIGQYVPALAVGQHTLAVGDLQGPKSDERSVMLARGEPQRAAKDLAASLSNGIGRIIDDLGTMIDDPKVGGFASRELPERFAAGLRSDLERARPRAQDLAAVLSKFAPERYWAVEKLLENVGILAFFGETLPGELERKGEPTGFDPVQRLFLYVHLNDPALRRIGERFAVLADALRRTDLALAEPAESVQSLDVLWRSLVLPRRQLAALGWDLTPGDGDGPLDGPPPGAPGDVIGECRVLLQCHWGAATGPVTAWVSEHTFGQRHCGVFTRINGDPKLRLGHHVQGNLTEAGVVELTFSTDAGFRERWSDYWTTWDSAGSSVADVCAMARCLRDLQSDYASRFSSRPYDLFSDGESITTTVHPNSNSFIGVMIDGCRVPAPKPGAGNRTDRPLVRSDFFRGYTGWHYWGRSSGGGERWRAVASAKARSSISQIYAPGLNELEYWLWLHF